MYEEYQLSLEELNSYINKFSNAKREAFLIGDILCEDALQNVIDALYNAKWYLFGDDN